ncbi:hypothetical protein AYO20_05358 [Fonsecaea nubica]|uniref:Uncharacterized protein n=1 Tax=Fonsecaea nubica TaxID=856822 RepID=A0A178D0X9_9EURO|nr:hypothetical protein AYO20_05358 [Fonsecaea nubica]OAL35307.1 hypothetical protein AYO20_05358 [Fonsecaea nubica]
MPGMLVNYAKAVAIIRSLEQRCIPNDYSQMMEFGAVRIMEVTHSFLDQQVTIKHKGASTTPRPRATAMSIDWMKMQLISAGATLPNIWVGQAPGQPPRGMRFNCDGCFIGGGGGDDGNVSA